MLRCMRTVLGLAALVLLVSGCSQDSSEAKKKPTGPLTFPYRPESCSYDVAIPDSAADASGHLDKVGADPTPKHIHVSWAGAPESTFAVNWATDADTLLTEVLFGKDKAAVEAADGPGASVTRARGHTMQLLSPLFQGQMARVHEVHVCGLAADTTYYYKVGGKGSWSAVYDVATAPAPGASAPFKFAITGDSRGTGDIFAQLQEQLSGQGIDFKSSPAISSTTRRTNSIGTSSSRARAAASPPKTCSRRGR